MINLSYTICFILFTSGLLNTPVRYLNPERFNVCQEIAEEAIQNNISPVVVVSIAWEESRFGRNTVSYTGCCHGPLQINPRYYCENGKLENCDLFSDGIGAVKRNHTLYSGKRFTDQAFVLGVSHRQEWEEVLCHYNAGNVCNEQSRRYARLIINIASEISYTYDAIEESYLMTCVQ